MEISVCRKSIMQQFAISLIWGEYKEGKLVAMFRYMEDGTFNTIDEEEHELTPDTVIGLIHPLELSEEEEIMEGTARRL